MSLSAALARGRAAAEALMVDTCTVEAPNGTTLDPVTLEEVPAWTSVYAGKARVQRTGALSQQESVVGGVEFGVGAFLAQLPLSAVDVEPGHRVTVTAVGAISDPDLVGLVGTVKANLSKTHATKRTLVCEEVSG